MEKQISSKALKIIKKMQQSELTESVIYEKIAKFAKGEENKKVFNIVLDSEEVIDLNRITEASRIINKIMDNHEDILDDCDELDIYSNEKGEIEGE